MLPPYKTSTLCDVWSNFFWLYSLIKIFKFYFINLDSRKFDESITFSGDGSENNTYLKKRFLYQENNGVDVIELSKLESKEYLNQIDSLKQWELSFLKENQNISDNFLNIEKRNTQYKFV